MTFDIYKYPRTTTSKPLGSLTFHQGTPIPQLPSECGVAILDYLRDTKTVFLPSLNIVPMDLKVDEHQRSFVGTLPCIGYQAVPVDGEVIGKDAEFESKHARDEDGRFAGHTVERWYDNRSKNWVVQTKDSEGNQVGDATYVGSKDEAIAAEKRHKEDVQTIGKDREFEEKHPRGEAGKFAEKGSGTTVDVKWEFEQALKQANKFKHANDRQNVMAAMLNNRRADALPQVVSEKEIEHHVAQGEMELWRGVAERRYATGFRGGPLHLGTGILGTGVYVALGPEGRTYAQDYTGQGQGALLHMSLPKDAKIADWRDVNREMEAEAKKVGAHKGPAYTKDDWRRVYTDVGLYAAAKGLDALVWPNLGMGLILNRNKVRVSRENLVAKALTMGNAGLSRRVAECMDTDRMTSLVLSPQYQSFVEAVLATNHFADLPEWCQEEIAEAESEMLG